MRAKVIESNGRVAWMQPVTVGPSSGAMYEPPRLHGFCLRGCRPLAFFRACSGVTRGPRALVESPCPAPYALCPMPCAKEFHRRSSSLRQARWRFRPPATATNVHPG